MPGRIRIETQAHEEHDEHVVVLHLENSPEGVMDAALVRALHEALDSLVPAPRVLMLTGTVPGVFVRRYDVDEFFAGDDGDLPALPRLIRRLEQMDTITVAALNGTALGGGFELALGCDFRLACDGPFRFGLRETDVGLVPGAGGSQRLVRLLGIPKTLELVLLGRLLKPQDAKSLGLIHHVFERDVFPEAARRFCRELAVRAPVALSRAKKAIREGAERSLEEGLLLEHEAFEACARTADARGAVQAYAAGRNYVFRGK